MQDLTDQSLIHELELHFQNCPSFIRSSLVMILIRIFSWLMMIATLAIGIALIIQPDLQIAVQWIAGDQTEKILLGTDRAYMVVGVTSLCFSFLSWLLFRHTGMVIRRNMFLLDLYDWKESLWEQHEEKSQAQKKSTT